MIDSTLAATSGLSAIQRAPCGLRGLCGACAFTSRFIIDGRRTADTWCMMLLLLHTAHRQPSRDARDFSKRPRRSFVNWKRQRVLVIIITHWPVFRPIRIFLGPYAAVGLLPSTRVALPIRSQSRSWFPRVYLNVRDTASVSLPSAFCRASAPDSGSTFLYNFPFFSSHSWF